MKISEEFKNKTITISRDDFGKAVADVVVRCEMLALMESTSPADLMKVKLLRLMLTQFSTDLMVELFGDEETDKLEVE